MTNNNEADNKIDDHRSRNQDLSLKITETRAAPHHDDLSQPRHKVKDPTPARKMTTIPRTSPTTTGHTLTGLSRKTTDLRHGKRNEKLFGRIQIVRFRQQTLLRLRQVCHTPYRRCSLPENA
jgi:hypothetical protein